MNPKLDYILSHASGPSAADFHFLVIRFEERWGFKPDIGETWVVRSAAAGLELSHGGAGWRTGLWRSASGRVFVSDSAGAVLIHPDGGADAGAWEPHAMRGTLAGVWGLDDQHVFAWGLHGQHTVMHLWDGSSWREIESPGRVFEMHAIAPDACYALAHEGRAARWDGHRWHALDAGSQKTLADARPRLVPALPCVSEVKRLFVGRKPSWLSSRNPVVPPDGGGGA